MNRKMRYGFLLFCVSGLISSCVSKNIIKFYTQNKTTLDSIEQSYREQFKHKAFTLEFTDKFFDHVSVEIWTDTIKYIYEFSTVENRLNDTLSKYQVNVAAAHKLIQQMQSIHCIWINSLDYYIGKNKNSMIFISIRPRALNLFSRKKYYIISYFNAPQYYDKDGTLMVNRKLRRARKINADIFHRINDKVAYTISDRFR